MNNTNTMDSTQTMQSQHTDLLRRTVGRASSVLNFRVRALDGSYQIWDPVQYQAKIYVINAQYSPESYGVLCELNDIVSAGIEEIYRHPIY